MKMVRFLDPHPENAAYDGLKKAIMELDGQVMTLRQGIDKLQQANKTSYPIERHRCLNYLGFDVPCKLGIMFMNLISFETYIINYTI